MMKKMVLAFLVMLLAAAYAAAQTGAQRPATMTVKVYFLNEKFDPNLENCTRVHPVARKIPRTSGVARAALEEFLKGVTPEEASKGYVSFPAEQTKGVLKSIKIKKGAAYVNFHKTVYEQLGVATTSCGSGFFSSIENTLRQFPTVRKVFYAIEGSPRDFYEWVQVGECPKELKNCSNKDF